ncbi:hypothetical protein SNEBB_009308 [Seison nebaliae]|nr:hypothetical protein SNEBB_009308 [Seison nebaliae]
MIIKQEKVAASSPGQKRRIVKNEKTMVDDEDVDQSKKRKTVKEKKVEKNSKKFSLEETEKKILEILKVDENGVMDEMVSIQLDIENSERLKTINSLLMKGKIELLRNEDNKVIYRLKNKKKDEEDMSSLSQYERLIYQLVTNSKSNGIWARDIRLKTNLSEAEMNKTLRLLQTKRKIKSVKSVGEKKKLYIRYDTEYNEEDNASQFASDDVEREFFQVLINQVTELLRYQIQNSIKKFPDDVLGRRNASFVNLTTINNYFKSSGISKKSISIQQTRQLMKVMELNGSVEKIIRGMINDESDQLSNSKNSEDDQIQCQSDDFSYFRLKKETFLDKSALVSSICLMCPLMDECSEKAAISPNNCRYFDEWLLY